METESVFAAKNDEEIRWRSNYNEATARLKVKSSSTEASVTEVAGRNEVNYL